MNARSADAPGPPLQWVIVGGGVHGVHIALQLLVHGGVPPEALVIVDPQPRLLDAWRRRTQNTGMQHLRSPAVHHLGLDPWELLHFAGANRRGRGARPGTFLGQYGRPKLDVFMAHSEALIQEHGLEERHIQAEALALELACDQATVRLDSGAQLRTGQVVLALGDGAQPRLPDWVPALRARDLPVQHIFEDGFHFALDDWTGSVAVVGGGISAAQVALRLGAAGREVHLISRHPLRKRAFDSDPGWVGPKKMDAFSAIECLDTRRETIQRARYPGSLPHTVFKALSRAIRHGQVHFHQGELELSEAPGAGLLLDSEPLAVDGVLLATGFSRQRPGGGLLAPLVEQGHLPCAGCGYPVVDPYLRWHPQVFVTGPLAELELGPVARNIIGARRAATRILSAPRVATTPAQATV